MVLLVTDTGFQPDDWSDGFVPLAAVSPTVDGAVGCLAVDLGSPELSPADWARLTRLLPRTVLVRIRLRHFGDATAFDLATSLRRAGFRGRIRAHGAVLAGHYTLSRRAGFSEIELLAHQAQMQPCEHWQNNSEWSPVRKVATPVLDAQRMLERAQGR